jgi:hypothetical protein
MTLVVLREKVQSAKAWVLDDADDDDDAVRSRGILLPGRGFAGEEGSTYILITSHNARNRIMSASSLSSSSLFLISFSIVVVVVVPFRCCRRCGIAAWKHLWNSVSLNRTSPPSSGAPDGGGASSFPSGATSSSTSATSVRGIVVGVAAGVAAAFIETPKYKAAIMWV